VSVDQFFTLGGTSEDYNYYYMNEITNLAPELQMDILPSLFDKEFYPDSIEKLRIMEANVWYLFIYLL
jgi:hypothetical protein